MMQAVLPFLPMFLLSLFLTLLLEGALALLFRMRGRDLLLFFLINLLTNPAAVYLDLVCRSIFPADLFPLWQLPLEFSVFLTEGTLYASLSHTLRRPWRYAAVANLFSYGVGILYFFVF